MLAFKREEEAEVPELVLIESGEKVSHAIELMQRYGISQIPVVRQEPAGSLADVVGSVRERGLLERLFGSPDTLNEEVAATMEPPLPAVELHETVDAVYSDFSGGSSAVVVAQQGRPVGVLTRADLLEYLAHQQGRTNGG